MDDSAKKNVLNRFSVSLWGKLFQGTLPSRDTRLLSPQGEAACAELIFCRGGEHRNMTPLFVNGHVTASYYRPQQYDMLAYVVFPNEDESV